MVSTRRKPGSETLRKEKLRVWLQLLKTTRAIEHEVRERFRLQFDSTLPRFDVLSALDRNPKGMKMSELSRALRVSNGNTTAVVERLVADGFVVRVTIDGDRRATLVCLTPKGQKLFAEMAAEHENWIDEIVAGEVLTRDNDLPQTLRALVAERIAAQ